MGVCFLTKNIVVFLNFKLNFHLQFQLWQTRRYDMFLLHFLCSTKVSLAYYSKFFIVLEIRTFNPFRDIRTPSDALGRPNGFNFCNCYMVKLLSCVLISFPRDIRKSQKINFYSSFTFSITSMVQTCKLHMCSLVNAMEVSKGDLESFWGILSRKNSAVPVPKLWYHNLLSLFLKFFILFQGM